MSVVRTSRPRIAVVIATRNRSPELANRSLRSVVEQTLLPDYLIVVDDSDRRYRPDNRRIVASAKLPGVQVEYVSNDRTAGASGAWNVALDRLHRLIDDPAELFVAILDDDDRWAPSYLERAAASSADMVGTDLLRIERLDDDPQLVAAPDRLSASEFLVGNQGIQGSNLFLRLSVLLAAGLFDEGLASTTDRDLCIRIADLGTVRYERLAEPLVRHFAEPGRARLTSRGSSPKQRGLTSFWRKYAWRMTSDQQCAFRARASDYFDWIEPKPEPEPEPESKPVTSVAQERGGSVALVVGIIAHGDRPEAFANLTGDLVRLQSDPRLVGLELIVLENGDSPWLKSACLDLRSAGVGCYLISHEQQVADARAGAFGAPSERRAGRTSIAEARTMLQTYAYVLAKQRTGAVVWILDGDCRLANIVWEGGLVVEQPSDILGALLRLREAGVDVAIGTVSDAPPVPFASCIRVQLVDAYHNLAAMAALDPDDPWPDGQVHNMRLRAASDDYYYDLSRRDTDHLEMPFRFVPSTPGMTVREAFCEMVTNLPRMFAGEQVFRPIILDGGTDPITLMQPSVHRGGNTFVFDVEALHEFPNAAPCVDDNETRRSDMFWSLFNSYLGRRKVVKLPLAVRQNRGDEPVGRLDLDKLARDIQGYALYSALEDLLLDTSERSLDSLDETELERRMRKFLRERLAAFSLSFHRAAAIGRMVGPWLDGEAWWASDPHCTELRGFIELVTSEYDLSRLPVFLRRVSDVDGAVVRRFVDDLRADLRARRSDSVLQFEDQRVAIARQRLMTNYGATQLRVLGSGCEAVVLTDGRTVYKVLDYWKTRMPQRSLEFLREQVGRWSNVPGLYPLEEVRTFGVWSVITYPYEPSEPYLGGHGFDLVRMLQGCRRVGIVCTNIHPNNLRLTASGVRLIDYGADIRPFTAEGFEQMARRAFLSLRFPDHADLKAIMTRALTDVDLPEFDDFDRFRSAVEPVGKEDLVDALVAAQLGDGDGRRLLDYGCGKGKLAESLAGAGWQVTAYDPNPDLPASDGRVEFGDRALLESLRASDVKFAAVVCSLVLCVLEDDELHDVVRDLRGLIEPNGDLIIAICNPRYTHGTTQLQRRVPPAGVGPDDVFHLKKLVYSSNGTVIDVHRPLRAYLELFAEVGLVVRSVHETPGVDLETFDQTSDFMIFQLSPQGAPHHVCA